jgi:hypothetical protein
MVRMQVQFTDEQAARLRRISRSRGVSIAAIVREAVDAALAGRDRRRDVWERALAVMGTFSSGGGSAADDHDEWFAEAVEAENR